MEQLSHALLPRDTQPNRNERASEREGRERCSTHSYKSRFTVTYNHRVRNSTVFAQSISKIQKEKTILNTTTQFSAIYYFIYLRFRALNANVLKFDVKYDLKQKKINSKSIQSSKRKCKAKNNGKLAKK